MVTSSNPDTNKETTLSEPDGFVDSPDLSTSKRNAIIALLIISILFVAWKYPHFFDRFNFFAANKLASESIESLIKAPSPLTQQYMLAAQIQSALSAYRYFETTYPSTFDQLLTTYLDAASVDQKSVSYAYDQATDEYKVCLSGTTTSELCFDRYQLLINKADVPNPITTEEQAQNELKRGLEKILSSQGRPEYFAAALDSIAQLYAYDANSPEFHALYGLFVLFRGHVQGAEYIQENIEVALHHAEAARKMEPYLYELLLLDWYLDFDYKRTDELISLLMENHPDKFYSQLYNDTKTTISYQDRLEKHLKLQQLAQGEDQEFAAAHSLASFYWKNNKLDEGVAVLEPVAKKYQHAWSYQDIANQYRIKGRPTESLPFFEAALAIGEIPLIKLQYAQALSETAMIAHREGDFVKATDLLSKAFRYDPQEVYYPASLADFYYEWGIAEKRKDYLQKALDFIQVAQTLDPQNYTLQQNEKLIQKELDGELP